MIEIKQYESGDEYIISEIFRTTFLISNSKDYSEEIVRENIRSHSPEVIRDWAKDAHFYIAEEDSKPVACGGITGYWGSKTESFLLTIFVLPEHQHKGIGRMIIKTLEADEYFERAWRTEVASSIGAVGFYRRMGYEFKNGDESVGEDGTVRLEKRK